MRRTLSVVAMTAALLVPTAVALADDDGHRSTAKSNASCNNGKGGNGAVWNGNGSSGKSASCTVEDKDDDDDGGFGPGDAN